MGTIGTFDSFTTARLAIYASQQGLSVTGNNIANINTTGYTRQRIDQVSLKTGANDMYRSMIDNHIGNGVLVRGISQIRDPFLDIRYRNITSDVGYTDTMLSGLQQIASILDEVGKGTDGKLGDGLLYAQIRDIVTSLQTLGSNPTKDNDNLTRTSAEALVSLFHTYADKLNTLRENTDLKFQKDLSAVNEILTNIRNLNENIREGDLCGDPGLELRDERNRQIDALAEYMHIDVTYSMEDIGGGKQVEKLTISLGNSNPDPAVTTDSSVLVDGLYATQFSISQVPIANPNDTDGTLPYLDADGNPVADLADAAMEDSSNYDLTLAKLLDKYGKEWNEPTTVWTEIVGGQVASKAVFSVQVAGSSNWANGDSLEIGGQTYTIGSDITADYANNPATMAAFIASKLNGSYDDYDVSSEGDRIFFTAKNPGSMGGNGPANPPTLTYNPGGADTNITLVPSDGSTTQVSPGSDSVAPGQSTSTVLPDGTEVDTIYTELNNRWFEVTTTTKHTFEVNLDDNDLYGSLQATRELLTENGKFTSQDIVDNVDENAVNKRGIPYYQKSLDLLAYQFAKHFNSLNQGYMVNEKGNYIDSSNKELTLAGQPLSKTNGLNQDQKNALIAAGYELPDGTADLKGWLNDNDGKVPEGSGVLFSIRGDLDDADGINASNIEVSASWSRGDVKIVPSFIQLFGEDGKPLPQTTQPENINHFISLLDKALVYNPKDLVPDAASSKLFTGSFNDMFSDMCTILGNDQRIYNSKLSSYSSSWVELDSSRENVSGVDLNDEAMNMIQYQKAYSAACRLMTTIDESLDRLINNTGIAGR